MLEFYVAISLSCLNFTEVTIHHLNIVLSTYVVCCCKNTGRFNFIVLYRLLDIPIKQFLSDLACLLETVSTFPGIVIVGGDVNFHLDKLLWQ